MVANLNANEEMTLVFAPLRRRIEVQSGALVQHPDGVFRIDDVLDFDTVTATSVESGRIQVLRIGELQSIESAPDVMDDVDIDAIDADDWRVAQSRYAAVKPLLEPGAQSRESVEQRAKELGISPATVYRWLQRYRSLDAVSGLVPFQRGWKIGNGRISAAAETLIKEVIESFHLTPERPTAQKTVREVQRIAHERGMVLPSGTAVRARIERIPEY